MREAIIMTAAAILVLSYFKPNILDSIGYLVFFALLAVLGVVVWVARKVLMSFVGESVDNEKKKI